jgi:hypothetical protein
MISLSEKIILKDDEPLFRFIGIFSNSTLGYDRAVLDKIYSFII